MLTRAIAEEIADHDRPGGDADAQLKGAGAAAIKLRGRVDQRETRTDRAFDVVFVRLRVPEIGQYLRPRKLAHLPAGPRDDRHAATLVGSNQRLQLLRIKSGRERAHAGKIADKDRYLPALRGAPYHSRFIVDLTDGVLCNRTIGDRGFGLRSVPLPEEVAVQCFSPLVRLNSQLL